MLKPSFNQFFIELAANNNKDWFDQNRDRYHKEIKKPFDELVQAVIEGFRTIEPEIGDLKPNDAIFRINRDIRFSKDKTPYKLNRSAIINPGGKKCKNVPGLYFEVGPESFRIYSGVYMLSSEEITRVREEICDHPEFFNQLINDPDFVDTFGEIRGEKISRLPKEMKEIAEKQPLLYNKNWYFFAKYDPEMAFSENLVDLILAHYSIAKPLCDFFKRPVIG